MATYSDADPAVALAERFWARVQKGAGENACWIWTGSTARRYGIVTIRGRSERAHRLSWEWANGPIPDGLVVCHHCDNPPCVRPDHLFVGTMADNLRDCARKGRCGAQVKPEQLARGQRNGAYTMPERLPRGESHGCVKLTEADVVQMRAAYQDGASLSQLATQYGMHRGHVSRIVNRKNWRHVA